MNAFTVIGAIAISLCSVILRAFVAAILWGWFISTPFRLPPIGAAQAFGLSLVFIVMFVPTPPEDKREIGVRIAGSILGPMLALLIGWIVRGLV